ncbi:glycosyltransferase family 4 protein [Loktanella sp. DJP18]|uniref:glycosyltransferase family 4 protein n=1 Tax=Loktanella sp. DJP18 TaxID=3409788 RepID=UPI003BB4F19E
MLRDPATISVIAPNLKRRLSGVTSTVIRLVPLQARDIAIAATGPVLPDDVPQIALHRLPFMSRHASDGGPRVWHARRNIEMIAGLALKHLLRKDLALMFTSASQRRHTALTAWLIARMDAVVATSALSAGYLRGPNTVIHHGIDTDTFAPAPDKRALCRSLNLPEDALLIGCYGRIRPSKGTDIFVEALLETLPRHPHAMGLVMGRAVGKDQPFLQALRDRVAAHGMTDRIRFLPEVPAQATAAWYAALDLYVAPQRHEGFGLTPLEAAACGVPSIATRTGAFADIVAEGETGTLIPTDNAAALSGALDAVLSDPDRLSRWSAACRPRILSGFRIADEAQALIAIYRDLLGRPASD